MSSSIESRLARRVPGFLALAPADNDALAASGRGSGTVEFIWATGSEPDAQGTVERRMVDRRTGEILWRESGPGWGLGCAPAPSGAGTTTRPAPRARVPRDQPTPV